MDKATAQPQNKKRATAKKKTVAIRDLQRIDPRQELTLAYLLDPTSESYRSVRGSAIRAGYAEEYADQLAARMPNWLGKVRIQEEDLLALAEDNIKELLTLPSETQAIGAFGPIFRKDETKVPKLLKNGKTVMRKHVEKVPVYTFNGRLIEIKQKTSHFVAETIGRTRYQKQTNSVKFNFNIRGKIAADKAKYA